MDLETIKKIVKASGVTAGEKVLVHFWGEDSDKSIANDFVIAAVSLGATPVLLQQSRTLNRDIFANAAESCFDDAYFEMLSSFDAVLDVFAYQPIILGYELETEKYELYRRYIAKLFGALMKAKRFTQLRIPTEANAEESGLEPTDYITRMDQAYDIDYSELYERCNNAKNKLASARKITIKTGTDCEITFDLTGREWHIDAGDGDMPCGEIYIAPNETLTNGTVFFPNIFIEDAGEHHNVKLFVKDGKVTGSDNAAVSAYFENLPENGNVVCELGFGMNPNVKSLCGYTVLDEKMAGTFHIAVGANTMFGGENKAPMHEDFVCAGEFEVIL